MKSRTRHWWCPAVVLCLWGSSLSHKIITGEPSFVDCQIAFFFLPLGPRLGAWMSLLAVSILLYAWEAADSVARFFFPTVDVHPDELEKVTTKNRRQITFLTDTCLWPRPMPSGNARQQIPPPPGVITMIMARQEEGGCHQEFLFVDRTSSRLPRFRFASSGPVGHIWPSMPRQEKAI